MKRSHFLLGSTVVLALCLMGFTGRAEALSISSLDFTSGAVNTDGRRGQILDRLLARDGSIAMGSYQSMSDIVDPITRGHKTFSLFTSGLNGAPAPSATINGSSISVDLSSLFLGITRGDQVRAWNIGGVATGLYNPQTSEFFLSWDHLFSKGGGQGKHESMGDRSATFFLHGKVDGFTPAPVPLSGSVMFFVTGLVLMGGLFWRKSSAALAGIVS